MKNLTAYINNDVELTNDEIIENFVNEGFLGRLAQGMRSVKHAAEDAKETVVDKKNEVINNLKKAAVEQDEKDMKAALKNYVNEGFKANKDINAALIKFSGAKGDEVINAAIQIQFGQNIDELKGKALQSLAEKYKGNEKEAISEIAAIVTGALLAGAFHKVREEAKNIEGLDEKIKNLASSLAKE